MRHEQLSVGQLIGGPNGEVTRFLKMSVVAPAAAVANRFVTSVNMKVGAYTIANNGLPGDGLAHNITVAQTAVGAEDTNGTITVTGTDLRGNVISEVIVPNAGETVQGTKAFAKVTSVIGAGWVINEGNDTIVVGFGEVIGLPDFIQAASDIVLAALDTALINVPTVTVGAALCQNTILATGADGTKKLRVLYQI
jgi:hypothetical protein